MVKTKKKTASIREFSAGGVVYKKENEKILWLITKSAPSRLFKSSWRLPKGWIDDSKDNQPGEISSGKKRATEEHLQKTALREVEEEGGVKARIIEKIGTEKYFYKREKKNILKFVTFFLMEWIKDKEEGPGFETEKVVWLPFMKAQEKLSFKGEKVFLRKARNFLDSKKS